MCLKFLYKLRSNTAYTESLNTLDDKNDQNYKKNKRANKSMEVYLRRLEQKYMEEQNEIEEMNQTQLFPWLINNIYFVMEEKWKQEKTIQRITWKKQRSLHGWVKEHRKKIGSAAVFTDIIRRGELPNGASIHTAEMTALKEIHKRKNKIWVIYTRWAQCSPSNTKKITQY